MEIAELEMRVSSEKAVAEQKKLQQELQRTGKSGGDTTKKLTQGTAGLTGAFTQLRGAVGMLTAALAVVGVGKFVRDWVNFQQEVLRLKGAINAAGIATEGYEKKLIAQSSALQDLTRFGDNNVLVVQRQLLLMGAQENHVEELTKLTLDFAEATGRSAEEVGQNLSRALTGNTTMLKRWGIEVDQSLSRTEQLRDVLRQMRRMAPAGSAAALGATDIGAVAQASNAFGDLRKHVGELFLLLGADTLRTTTEVLKEITETVRSLSGWINSVKADSPLMKLLLTSPLAHAKNLSKAAGSLSAGGSFEEFMSLASGKDPFGAMTKAGEAANDGLDKVIEEIKVKSMEEIQSATESLEALRMEMMMLGSTSESEMARIQSQFRFDKMAEDVLLYTETLADADKITAEQVDSINAMFTAAQSRQNELLDNARELEEMQNRLMRGGGYSSGTVSGNTISLNGVSAPTLGNEIRSTRTAAGKTTTVEAFEHETAKLEMLMQERNRRLEFNVSGPAESFAAGWDMAAESFGSSAQRIAAVGAGLADSIDRNVTDALVGMIDGTMSVEEAFSKMANAIIQDLIRVMIQQMVVRSMMSAFGGVGVMHSGGVVGAAMETRSIGAEAFTGAGRYAGGGVAGDEVPIIAHRGEVVLNEDQFGQMINGNRREQQKVEVINVMDPGMVDERLAANPNAVLNVISKHRQTIRASLGFR